MNDASALIKSMADQVAVVDGVFHRMGLVTMDKYKAPPPASDERVFVYDCPDLSEPLECHCAYSPAEVETVDCFVRRSPASCILTAAFIRGVDIVNVLSPSLVKMIEEMACVEFAESDGQ